MNWDFRHRPDREFAWETYWSPQSILGPEVMGWCFATFGNPANDRRWDYHGGWIKFAKEEDVALFLLRWS